MYRMISSLTGFGRASYTDEAGRISVELKSVNNRFLQIDIHLPYGFGWADALIRKYVSNQVSRGKIYINVDIVDYNPSQEFIINKELLKRLVALKDEISTETNKELNLSFSELLLLPGVMKSDSAEANTDDIWARINPVLEEAVELFVKSRQREGQSLADDLKSHGKDLNSYLDEAEKLIPEYRESFSNRFKERITELAGKAGLDEARLATEIALWADKTDVSEEIVRLRSHLKELENILQTGQPVGRKLDFLVQELNREANTLGNKINDFTICQIALNMKCSIEKIREQAQNIE